MQELELMELIYKGVDPRTGEVLSTPREPVLDKRRAAYLEALRGVLRRSGLSGHSDFMGPVCPGRVRPVNQGARWLDTDDQRLRECWSSSESSTIEEMADLFGRNAGGITARLVKLGIFPSTDAAKAASRLRKQLPP